MKKTKLLAPILATATIGSMIAPLVLLTSCNKTNDAVELDASTAKEQTTDDNKTVTTYCFNLKNKLVVNTNEETETEEIEVETEDVETTDDVTIEVSALQYDPTTGKFYVTITASKEDGTLNDQETISFSLNLRCVGKKSRSQRWAKKFTHFVIKHSASQLWSGHFNDTDVTKTIKKDKETQKGVELTEEIIFPINPADVWKESEAGENEYDLTKLKCYVLQDLDMNHFIETIKLPEHSEEMKLELSSVDEQQYLSVTIPYTINQLAHYGTKARFTLLFTYDGNTVFQTIGGFSINYVESAVEPHLVLANSREQHYYDAQNTNTEKGSNIISFILDSKTTYKEEDFTITSSSDRMEIGNKYIFNYETEYLGNVQILTVAYSIKDKQQNPTPRPESDNLYNISLTVESKNEDDPESTKWTETVKGFSFYKGTSRFEEGTLISSDAETLKTITYKATTTVDFTDVLRTCKPFDLKQFTYVDSYAVLDEGQQTEKELPFAISSLGWNPMAGEHYSVSTLDATTVAAGNHTLKIYVYVISEQAAYAYSLNVGTVNFAE